MAIAEPPAVGGPPVSARRSPLRASRTRVRRRLPSPPLARLSPAQRATVVVLLVHFGVVSATLVFAVVKTRAAYDIWPPLAVLGSVAILAGLTAALAALAGVVGGSAGPFAAHPRLRRASASALPLLALGALLAPALLLPARLVQLEGVPVWAVPVALWVSLAVATLVVTLTVRRRRPAHRFDRVDALRVVVAPALLGVLLLILVAGWRSVPVADGLLVPVLGMACFVALAVVPTVLVAGGVAGLLEARQRGDRLTRVVDRRRSTLVVLLLAKLALVGAVLLAGSLRHTVPYVVWTGTIVTIAVLLSLLVVVLFVVDRHLRVSSTHHPTVTRTAALAVGVPMGALALLTGISTLLVNAGAHPWSLVGLAALILLAGLTVTLRRRRGLIVVPLAVAGAVVVGRLVPTWQRPAGSGFAWSTGELAVVLAVPLAGSGLVLAVRALRRREFGWIVYLLAVGLWVTAVSVVRIVAPEFSLIQFDLVLTVTLLVAGVLWLAGRQRQIDGREVLIATVSTLGLIEIPAIVALAPERWQTWVFAAVILLPGLGTATAAVRALAGPGDWRNPLGTLALTVLTYALLASLVWIIGITGAQVVSTVSELVLAWVSVPLALLLATTRAGTTATPPPASA